jgi:plastocyanin
MRKLLLLSATATALALAGSAPADNVAVGITAAGFTPLAVTVQNGDRVVWTNRDSSNHQVVADDGSFRSAVLQPGDRYSRVFRKLGAFPYHDGVQPAKHGTVTVVANRGVTISTNRRVVTFNGFVVLSGSVSSGKTNEQVVIREKPYGSNVFSRVTTVLTGDNGDWDARLRPGRNTVYEAVWKNVHSPTQTIGVKPRLTLKRSGRARFTLGVHADTLLRYRTVLVQRWVRTRHSWRTVATARLRFFRASSTESVSTAIFRARFRRGTLVRGVLSARQAAPTYMGPALSRAVRV